MPNHSPSASRPLDPVAVRTALFFRTYRLATLPLYDAMVAQLCASPHLPFELSTVLEDIGQAFMRLADTVNDELLRRGALGHEAEGAQTTDARIDQVLERILAEARRLRPAVDGRGRLEDDLALEQALRTALQLACETPLAPPP